MIFVQKKDSFTKNIINTEEILSKYGNENGFTKDYLDYINRHVANVKLVHKKLMDSSFLITETSLTVEELDQLSNDVKVHDLSKYSDEEFIPYRVKFFDKKGKTLTKQEEEDFEEAWKHHYTNNNHHWNYWVTEDGVLNEMSEVACIHMIIDWMAMGIEFNNTALEYYNKNREKINLHSNTREYVQVFLHKFYN